MQVLADNFAFPMNQGYKITNWNLLISYG